MRRLVAFLIAIVMVLVACSSDDQSGTGETQTSDLDSHDHVHETPASLDPQHGALSSSDGYTLKLDDASFVAGQPGTLTFHITNPAGETQKDFATDQTKLMHAYVVRADLTNYQHLHPTGTAGKWSVPLTIRESGPYRVFTDFIALEQDDVQRPLVLSETLTVPGNYSAVPLAPPSDTAVVDGYTVNVTGHATAGTEHSLTATFAKNGQPVLDLQPYLDTYAHVTAFHAESMAFTHFHPLESVKGVGGGPSLSFLATFPAAGSYRMFLQFQTGGALHTAELTYAVR